VSALLLSSATFLSRLLSLDLVDEIDLESFFESELVLLPSLLLGFLELVVELPSVVFPLVLVLLFELLLESVLLVDPLVVLEL
jgi:hypothetical protein